MADRRLLYAAEEGDTESLDELLSAGECNINVRDWDGKTPLHWTALIGNTDNVKLLLQHGADTSIQDKGGWTPLYLAAQHGRTQCVQLLLQHGADTNIQELHGWTPLHWAAQNGHTQRVQLLLQHGADTNIQSQGGITPLHWAARFGRTQCVQLLLQHGADASIQSQQRKTPRTLAKERGHSAIAEQLRRIEIPDMQRYVYTRTLEHLAEILEPAEYTFINQTNLNSNFPGVSQFQKVQGLKVWATKNNCTNIRDLRAGLQAANRPRLSSAAVDYYAEMVTEIPNMASSEFAALCRTLITARHMYRSGATTADQQDTLSDILASVIVNFFNSNLLKFASYTPRPLANQISLKQMSSLHSSSVEDLRYDAFIAHSSEDKAVVEPVLEQLEERGVQCCYGVRDFHPGKSVITSMGEAVYGSKRTIVFLSKSFMESPFCEQERDLAKYKAVESGEDVVIPVLMDLPPQQIPFELKSLKYIPIKDEKLIPKLIKNIKGPTKSPTYGELRNALQDERGENAFLRDENRKLKTKLRQQCQ